MILELSNGEPDKGIDWWLDGVSFRESNDSWQSAVLMYSLSFSVSRWNRLRILANCLTNRQWYELSSKKVRNTDFFVGSNQLPTFPVFPRFVPTSSTYTKHLYSESPHNTLTIHLSEITGVLNLVALSTKSHAILLWRDIMLFTAASSGPMSNVILLRLL